MAEKAQGRGGGERTADATTEAVGLRLRAARRYGGMTLREVASAAGMSESFLSQLERGKASASIASLARLTAVLGLSMAELFEPRDERAMRPLREAQRPQLQFGDRAIKFLLSPPAATQIEAFVALLAPGGSTGEHPHAHGDAEELVLVLRGTAHAQIGDDRFELRRGDSITYRSSEAHRISNRSDEEVELMWVVSPPGG